MKMRIDELHVDLSMNKNSALDLGVDIFNYMTDFNTAFNVTLFDLNMGDCDDLRLVNIEEFFRGA